MSWFRIDDKFHTNRKVIMAGNAAVGLYTRCGAYCSDHLTDGHIPRDVARLYGSRKEIAQLLQTRMWTEDDDGYLMPDYLTYNPSREKVLAERAAAAERQHKAREAARSRRESQESHGVTTTVTSPVSHGPPDPYPTPSNSLVQVDSVEPPRLSLAVSPSATERQTEFAAFWEQYPRREAKKAAARAFNTARKETTLPVILGALGPVNELWKDPAQRRYVPLPATWLNAGRWEDEAPINGSTTIDYADRRMM